MKTKIIWHTEIMEGVAHTCACVGNVICGRIVHSNDKRVDHGYQLLLPTFPRAYHGAGSLKQCTDQLEDLIYWWFEQLEEPYEPQTASHGIQPKGRDDRHRRKTSRR